MKIKKIRAVFFSANGTTKKVVTCIAERLAILMDVPFESCDFTLPINRTSPLRFSSEELVVFGVFVVAGRVPNVLLSYLDTLQANGALAIPIVVYGNRHYDDALIELRDILKAKGADCIAAAAFLGQHSFSDILAYGRPDPSDRQKADAFAAGVAEKVKRYAKKSAVIDVPGVPFPYRGYYQPCDEKGLPVVFLKAKPVTSDACTDCKLCADICPMGAIDRESVNSVPGLCIKCCACIKKCPAGAKSFQDENFLSHRAFLEKTYVTRKEPEVFF